jgi:hypothetical protein
MMKKKLRSELRYFSAFEEEGKIIAQLANPEFNTGDKLEGNLFLLVKRVNLP